MTLSTPGAADTLAPGAPADSMRIEDFVTDVDQLTAFAFLPDGRLLITRKSGELVLASAEPRGFHRLIATASCGLVKADLQPYHKGVPSCGCR